MFVIQTPTDFGLGQTISVNINGQPTTLTYLDIEHLRIGADDVRQVLIHFSGSAESLQEFYCSDK